MRIPRSSGFRRLRQILRYRSRTYQLTRTDVSASGRFGENDATETTVEADIWLFDPEERPVDTDFGEREVGDLEGLALPSEDIQSSDELTHGGQTYEVHGPPMHLPSNDDKQIKLISLTKKTN